MRKKKERIEADLATQVSGVSQPLGQSHPPQVSEYDTNMAEMQRQIKEIKLKMAEEKDRLRELEEYFAKIDANQKRQSREVAILATFRRRVPMCGDHSLPRSLSETRFLLPRTHPTSNFLRFPVHCFVEHEQFH